LILLWVISILSSSLPFFVARRVKDTLLFFSTMNCLSGGVVLGAALSHMLPDAQDNFNEFWVSYTGDIDTKIQKYPFPGLIAAVGLLTLIIIDRTILGDAHSHSEVTEVREPKASLVVNNATQTQATYGTVALKPELETAPLLAEDAQVDIGYTDSLNEQMAHLSHRGSPTKSAVKRAWIFLAALSVHSVLEGLGIGAEDQKDAFYSVLLAVIAHKCLEAFALGLSVYYANFSQGVGMLLVGGYSLATPFGLACGMVVAQLSSAQNLIAGILVSIAAGSFLYISLIEILPTELHKPHGMTLKLLCMVAGWGGMAILAYFA